MENKGGWGKVLMKVSMSKKVSNPDQYLSALGERNIKRQDLTPHVFSIN